MNVLSLLLICSSVAWGMESDESPQPENKNINKKYHRKLQRESKKVLRKSKSVVDFLREKLNKNEKPELVATVQHMMSELRQSKVISQTDESLIQYPYFTREQDKTGTLDPDVAEWIQKSRKKK